MAEPLLEIRDLSVSFATADGAVPALERVSLDLRRGEILSVVGESGAGKTTLAAAVIRLLAPNARITGGAIRFDGEDLVTASAARLAELRGAAISMIAQNPRAALNPVRRVAEGIVDTLRAHRSLSRGEAKAEAIALLGRVGFREPERVARAYPHELSGGMCQRVAIAMATACEPAVLIADEPTTALDSTGEHGVMALLESLVRERRMALLLITHDLSLAARHCDRIAVMREGHLVEHGPAPAILARPREACTRALVAATPRAGVGIDDLATVPLPPRPDRPAAGALPLLQASRLTRRFGKTVAVDEVTFSVGRGECVGVVGESGSGKSTLARIVSRLIDPDAGRLVFDGADVGGVAARRFHAVPGRRRIQLVFQDPSGSLNPRATAFEAIADPLRRLDRLHGAALNARVHELAGKVQLSPTLLRRRAHQLSGGQRTRVGIARAIAPQPDLLILDEPTAGLDVSVQAAILTLVERLRRELGLSCLFISHDLAVVRMMCDRTLVMRQGRIVEEGETAAVFEAPREAYTRALVAAMPEIGAGGRVLP